MSSCCFTNNFVIVSSQKTNVYVIIKNKDSVWLLILENKDTAVIDMEVEIVSKYKYLYHIRQ